MTENTSDVQNLKKFLKSHVVAILKPKTLLLLKGELGVGKTQTVKFLAEMLGGSMVTGSMVTSPTFSVIQNYDIQNGVLYHCDLYRIESAKDLEFTGFWDLFNDTKAIVCVEWPEKMNTHKIAGWSVFEFKLEFDSSGETKRKLTFTQL